MQYKSLVDLNLTIRIRIDLQAMAIPMVLRVHLNHSKLRRILATTVVNSV